jgi:hypothetical protein
MKLKVLLAFAAVVALASTTWADTLPVGVTQVTIPNGDFTSPAEVADGAHSSTNAAGIASWSGKSLGGPTYVINPTTVQFAQDNGGVLTTYRDPQYFGSNPEAVFGAQNDTQCLWEGGNGTWNTLVYQNISGALTIAKNMYYTVIVSVGKPNDSSMGGVAYASYGIEVWAGTNSNNLMGQNWDLKTQDNSPTGVSTPLVAGQFTDVITQFSTFAGSTGKNGTVNGTKWAGNTSFTIDLTGENAAYTNVRMFVSSTGYFYGVPEPATASLLAMAGVCGVFAYGWRRWRKRAT